MATSHPNLFTRLRSVKAEQAVLVALGLLLAIGDYDFWQAVGAVINFFAFGSGDGHNDEGLLVAVCFLCLHVGLLGWLFWRRLLYLTWWVCALSVGVAISHFASYVLVPWYNAPQDSTHQRYRFAKGAHRYEITLEEPGHGVDISDITDQPYGTTTSLLMGNYQARQDTIFLQEVGGPRQCFIYRGTLAGFENDAMPIPLTREQDIPPFTLR